MRFKWVKLRAEKKILKSRENVKIVFDPQCEKGLSLTKLNYTQKRRCVSVTSMVSQMLLIKREHNN